MLDDFGDGIKIIRDGREILSRRGTPVGHIVELRAPSSRMSCKQAEAYLSYAVEV